MPSVNDKLATADDLDDGLEYEVNDSEGEAELVTLSSDHENETVEIDSQVSGKKRQAKSENFKSKKKQKSSDITNEKRKLAFMPKDMIADVLASKIKSKNSELSTIELNELYINQSSIEDTLDFKLDRSLDNLPKFVEHYFSETVKSNGLILILSISALRACEVARALKGVKGGALKLISKNKLSYDKKAIESKVRKIAASTPGRTQKLLSEKILDSDDISVIIMDSSFLDIKISNVWDLNETIPVVKNLTKNSHAKVYLY